MAGSQSIGALAIGAGGATSASTEPDFLLQKKYFYLDATFDKNHVLNAVFDKNNAIAITVTL